MFKTRFVPMIALLTVLTAWAVPVAHGGEIHPDLELAIEEALPGDTLGALVMMREQADIASLKQYFKFTSTTRQVRHEAVVTTLIQTAEATQGEILTAINAVDQSGAIERTRPFWIVNAVGIRALPHVIVALAEREDVAVVYPDYPIELIEPVYEGPNKGLTAEVESGVEVTGAPALWAIGIDGTGALVCDMDTGADGNHVAFADRWRGLDPGVSHTAAWFDPVTSTDFPFDSGSHGTHTMGTILGKDGDHTIGMAPGAKWIAAGVIDRVSMQQTIEDALATMQWTTDPDGNPGTVEDVPDVTNNSWGVPGTNCEDTFWSAIDNAEAAGTVYVWAAGNEGPFSRTLRSPADRIETDVNTFSVGALKQGGTRITSFSSRGPSDCDYETIKPEVAAVGDDVLSSTPNNNYGTKSGTSMAAPHVSGAVALLRSAHPDATVDEVKRAILNNCVDLGDVGEDNKYGMGRIEMVGALGELGFISGGGLKGTIIQKESQLPINAVEVTLEQTKAEMITGADGKYRFLIEDTGSYDVTVYHPEYGTFYETVEVLAGPWTVLDFELSNVPVVDFTSDKQEICEGDTVQFQSLSEGLITAYVWDFGDSSISTEQDPSHQYTLPGSFSVFLYVGGPTGEDDVTVPDYIRSYQMPAADFSASLTEAAVDQEIEFTDLSAGPAASWLWDFGDETTSEQQNPVKSYSEPGTYTVSLNAINACGEDTLTREGYITVTGESDDDTGDDDDDDDGGCGC